MNRYSCHRYTPAKSRRDFLALSSFGFGAVALNYLLDPMTVLGSTNLPIQNSPLAPKSPHFPSKAKSVIFIFLQERPRPRSIPSIQNQELAKLGGRTRRVSRNGMLGLAQIKAEEAEADGISAAPSRSTEAPGWKFPTC
ncbi:MAG: hypothetical protein U0V70_05005 [Terriglobia bacterium]